MEDLLLEVKALREDNARLQKRLDDKDAEIHRLNRQALGPTNQPHLLRSHRPAPVEDNGMEHEDGEVIEDLSATKLAAFKADLTKTVVAELLVAMKEEGFPRPTPTAYARRPPPPTFSRNATPDHAARVVLGAPILVVKFLGLRVFTCGDTSKEVPNVTLCKAAAIEKKLTDKGVLIPAFDPLEVPKLNVASSKSLEEREKEVREQALLYAEERQRRDADSFFRHTEPSATEERLFAYPRKIIKRPVVGSTPGNTANTNRFAQLSDDDEDMDDANVDSDINKHIDLMAIVETWLAPTDGIPSNAWWLMVPLRLETDTSTGRLQAAKVNGSTCDVTWGKGDRVGGAGCGHWGEMDGCQGGNLGYNSGYLPPMAGNGRAVRTMLEDFNAFRDGIEQQYPASPMVVVGDFNARMGILTGDSNTVGDNQRKTWMHNWIHDPGWTRLEPSKGKWTTHARNGNGITDFVFLNTAALPLAPDLVVHEDTTMGSDHSLLTIDIPLPTTFWKPPFSRINISKLEGEGCVRFRDRLKEGRQDVMTKLGLLELSGLGGKAIRDKRSL
ncbi:hypothetical protein BC829DRAFT_424092 [Chytridium lagenaria]|nr:hypothetical protein BC829DRAFT_424092 [Chytridium lagenaria]